MSFSNVCAEGELDMEYELRVVVEKVLVSTQEVVKRDTLKTYDVKPPESIEFIPIKPLVATGSGAPGSCAGHSRVPSPDHGHPASTGESGLSRCDSASHYY